MMIKKIFYGPIFFVLLCFVGCASVEGLYVDPSFNFGSLARGNIGVGGVVSVVNRTSRSQLTALGSLISGRLLDQYPGLTVMPVGDTVRALGASRYWQMMGYYQENGVVPDQYLSALRRHVSHIRYLVFARIVDNRIGHQRTQDVDDPAINTGTTIHYSTVRTLRIHMDVYDLDQHRVVWGGSYGSSRSTANSYTIPGLPVGRHHRARREMESNLLAMAGTALVDANHQYPSPPSLTSFASDVFRMLIKKFPMPVES